MSRNLVIVTHHLDSAKPHLKRCLEALLRSRSTDSDKVIVASDASPIIRLPGYERFSFIENVLMDTTAKKNASALSSVDLSKYDTLILMSDDVVVSSSCIDLIADASKHFGAVVAPLTNTELGCNVIANVVLDGANGLRVRHRHTIEEIDPYLHSIYNMRGPSILTRVPWVSFACVAMPLRLYADLGGIDPALEYRHNDQYFCMQAMERGCASFINLEAFALHYGSVTIENIPGVEELQNKCSEAFAKKISTPQH